MKVIEAAIAGVYIIEPEVFGDSRGWFMETYSKTKLAEWGLITEFVQDNHSFSDKKGVLRGLHFQNLPMAQTKLVRCTQGAIMDVAVDIRKGSPSYKKWVAFNLSAENKRQLYIPIGFAHAFLTLTDHTQVQYKVDAIYSGFYDRSVCYNDPSIGIDWGDVNPILSEKDKNAPLLDDSDANFIY